jgi:Uma2 family endonuclease
VSEPAAKVPLSYDKYLELEAISFEKHEYLCGEIFAMAGGTPAHAALAAALARILGNQLQGRPCRVFSSDLRIRVDETDFTAYPDLTVVCGKLEVSKLDLNAVVNPVILIEVLSESSEGYDRGEKFAHYRRLPSLVEYVLVSRTVPRLEVMRKNAQGRFELFEASGGQTLRLVGVPVELSVDEIFFDPLTGATG